VINDFLAFVHDIPCFGVCGIFPPFQITNSIFSRGGGDGGMSPGAIWSPFTITEEEYEELVEAVKKTSGQEISSKARYCKAQFEFEFTED
jgi:hypothetical protein